MLRLPPTRILLDARDVESHAPSKGGRFQQLISQGLKKKPSLSHQFPLLHELRASLESNSTNTMSESLNREERFRVSQQLLRDTLLPGQGRRYVPLGNSDLLSIDGQSSPAVVAARSLEELSAVPRTVDRVIPEGIEKLSSRFQSLATEEKRSSSIGIHESRSYPIERDPDRPSRRPGSAQCPWSALPQTPQITLPPQTSPASIGRISYSNPANHLRHASPAEPASYQTPRGSLPAQHTRSFSSGYYPYHPIQIIPQTMSSGSSTMGINQMYPTQDPTLQHYYTYQPGPSIGLPQEIGTPLSIPNLPRTPSGQRRPRTVDDYSDVFDFGRATDPWNRLFTSRNARARQRNELFVYEDNLPSVFQPQTPVGLPRHGIPQSYRAYPSTAPPARRSSTPTIQPITPTRPSRRHQNMGFQTRLSTPDTRHIGDHDQENAALYAEMARRRQSRADRRVAMRGEESLLDVTPPGVSEDGMI